MKLPALIEIGSYLVLGVDHSDRLVRVEQAANELDARRAATALPPDLPVVVILRVENQARGRGAEPRRPDPVEVPGARLSPGKGIVIGAAIDGAVLSVRVCEDLNAAYHLERARLSPSIPRAVLGVVVERVPVEDRQSPKQSRRRR